MRLLRLQAGIGESRAL